MKHNRNYQRIDDAIVNAYKELLREKGSPDASITELCKRAGVNRTTFYKHYRGIYEITDKIEDQLIYSLFNSNVEERIGFEDFLHNPQPSLQTLNESINKDLLFYKNALRPERLHYIIDKVVKTLTVEFKKDFPNLAKNPDVMVKVNINITSFIGSMGTIYLQYLNGHLNCTLEDISKYITRVVTTVYKGVKIPN